VLAVERPADRVLDQAGLVVGCRDFPQFLDADAVGLRVEAVAQIEPLDQMLGQRAAAALGEQRVGARNSMPR
jgi:hypothetical protein